MKVKKAPSFYDPRRDGVTQGLLSQFMFCRERARIGLQGWTRRAGNLGSTFGNLMHATLERMYDDVRTKRLTGVPPLEYLAQVLLDVEQAWQRDNPLADATDTQYLQQGLMLAAGILPVYCEKHADDFTKTKWIGLEHQFHVVREIPDIGPISLRGKLDGQFRLNKHIGLLETKTRGQIDEEAIADILPFELQVNTYLVAQRMMHHALPAGVWYNVVRRPQLRQKNGETFEQFATRVSEDVRIRPDWYFVRMEMTVEDADLDRFEGELDDLIKDFVDWWEGRSGHYKNTSNCKMCEALPICAHRDFTQFFKRPTVFRELEEM